ncbi:hypothetical protein OZ668_10580 [Elizabethkingia sp. HX XZB]|uniref:hypothetical protein n=1 Tax=Elizabethkingia sp. HX XZB TaxID=3003193 RepID=UPI002A23D15C|nr:hypothetical protein [Elizabethkingia sp. HX XZB]MDX8568435.1 hypothetical protein [Elizabethkingia sp. HX XZB]
MNRNKKILLVHHTLGLGGGEKLVYELAKSFIRERCYVEILILGDEKPEYYDKLLEELSVNIIRINYKGNKTILSWKFLKQCIKIKLLRRYDSYVIVNIHNAFRMIKILGSNAKINVWHVGNAIQYKDRKLGYPSFFFKMPTVRLWLINKYQKIELEQEYGEIKNEIVYFKLFIN